MQKGGPVGRFRNFLTRIGVVGAVSLVAGSMMIVGGVVVQQALSGSAGADTSPFELFCTNTPIGNLVFNGVVITGSLSPAAPSPGQQFSLTNFQTQITLPAAIVQEASAVGNTSISGTSSITIVASGATPSSMPLGTGAYDQAIPNPIPSSGMTLYTPSSPSTVGPFTATSSNTSLSLASSFTLTFDDSAIPGGLPPIQCSAYPNDVMPSGFAQAIPPGLPISPVIAFAGSPPPPLPTDQVTGNYELYCPHTPVGDLVFNDVTTSATISPDTLSAGDQFQVTGYQTDIPVPAGPVTSAVGLGNSSFTGLAASNLDAYGATPAQMATGSMGFNLPIPDPVPSTGLSLGIPATPIDLGPFTADGGPITIAQDQSILVVAKLSGKAFKMSCTAYPNDSIATSGSTDTPPAATPIRPIIAMASASGTPITTTTTTNPTGPPGTGNQTPGSPYELYCPGTPVGDIAVNDVVTTGSISPTTLNEGDSFEVSDLQTQFTIPQSVAQDAENLGLTTLSGDLSFFLDVTGTEYSGYPTSVATFGSSSASGTAASSSPPTTSPIVATAPIVTPIYLYPSPGEEDLTFSVTLPSPVPSAGVQFTAMPPAGSQAETFIAAGGPIEVFVTGANLNVSAFGDQFGLFCNTLANNSVPTGLSTQEPYNGFIQPLVTTSSATTNPPPPAPPSSAGSYELVCPGTPVGTVVINDVVSSGQISPADPTPGQQFQVTGYQTNLTIPAQVAKAANAIQSTIQGTVSATLDVSGATPTSYAVSPISFNTPIPDGGADGAPISLPSSPESIGPFTASGGPITVSQNQTAQLTLLVGGSPIDTTCTSYPDNSNTTGLLPAVSQPAGSPVSPVIATTSASVPTSTVSPVAPASESGSSTTQPSNTSTTGGSNTDPSTSSSADPAGSGSSGDPAGSGSSGDPDVVSASSGSLAFTGSGGAIRWLGLSGTVLVLVGIVLLLLSDTPRRLICRVRAIMSR